MVKKSAHDSNFTSDLRRFVNRLNDQTVQKDSVFDRAVEYFDGAATIQENLDTFEQKTIELNASLTVASGAKQKSLEAELAKLTFKRTEYKEQLAQLGQVRHQHLRDVCYQLIDLSEGENFEESLRKSAQMLGTIQLICPTEGRLIAITNERFKPVYKAVLCLRLLDELIISNQLNEPYVSEYLSEYTGEKYKTFAQSNPQAYKLYTENVKIAVVMAALVQDIGNYHPSAQSLLLGEEGTADPFRTLETEERKLLLQIIYRETNDYIVNGLSPLSYFGNSKTEKKAFVQQESQKIVFIRRLIKSAISPKKSIGNLLKVPQVYTSIIMSTKNSYNYKVLPKVYNALNLNAERGICQQSVVDSLYKVTGIFPQGYGITYIPKASDGSELDFYEYAVVSQLYPELPEEPICRQATRNLTFISYGHDVVIKKSSNLYFVDTAKKFSRVSKKRLLEILEQLSSNFEERKDLDLLPRCWLPNSYFSVKNHQKLWNRQVQ